MDQLFTGKYRPQTLEEIVLSDRIRQEIGDGTIKQNLLFYSSTPGTGKTSISKILAKNYDYLYLNMSDESGVDTVRTKITDFCSTRSVLGDGDKPKVLILDEADGISDQAFKCMRSSIESFSEKGMAYFIMTCNHFNKIPDAIQNRFNCINFNPISKEEEKELKIKYFKYIMQLMKKVGIEISKDAAIEFVKRNFPSMRAMVSKTQSFYDRGIKEIGIEDIKVLNYNFEDIFKMIMTGGDPYQNYVLLMSQYSGKVDDVIASLINEFPGYVREFHQEKANKIPLILIESAYYGSQRVTAIDPVHSLLGCIFKLQMIMNQ